MPLVSGNFKLSNSVVVSESLGGLPSGIEISLKCACKLVSLRIYSFLDIPLAEVNFNQPHMKRKGKMQLQNI